MRQIILRFGFLVLLLLTVPVGAEQLRVPFKIVEDVENLRLRYGLPELLEHLEQTFSEIDRPLLRIRRWRIISSYYAFRAAKKQIKLLTQARDIQKSICELDHKLAANADISDVDVLREQAALIGKEIQLLTEIETARKHLLTILELSSFLEISHNEREEEITQNSDAGRD